MTLLCLFFSFLVLATLQRIIIISYISNRIASNRIKPHRNHNHFLGHIGCAPKQARKGHVSRTSEMGWGEEDALPTPSRAGPVYITTIKTKRGFGLRCAWD
ncbi:hypothetical protein B0T24DRAFT_223748 [Lasiosphaeria ovina]|uniref:Uncharacterized protein n=1 Tax=Lasiosphaeria ovina TaxID=92902 RepID=A0AAE0KI34_9PEZI|nr:hypothetical protein B0T24DRAFT_223748 [Lasiosphaeria ovina]